MYLELPIRQRPNRIYFISLLVLNAAACLLPDLGYGSHDDAGAATSGASTAAECICSSTDLCCDGCHPMNDELSCSGPSSSCDESKCRGGRCVMSQEAKCQIDGECVLEGANNPAQSCMYCDPARNPLGWSSRPSGAACDDGVFCNGVETCDDSGACVAGLNKPCGESDACQLCDEPNRRCTLRSDATWYDEMSDLTWEMIPGSDSITYEPAKDRCDALTFCGRSDWRLPTISELRSLIRGCPATQPKGQCGITDSCLAASCKTGECGICTGTGPGPAGQFWSAELLGRGGYTYSSSLRSDDMQYAWFVNFTTGRVEDLLKGPNGSQGMTAAARCVRTGR